MINLMTKIENQELTEAKKAKKLKEYKMDLLFLKNTKFIKK